MGVGASVLKRNRNSAPAESGDGGFLYQEENDNVLNYTAGSLSSASNSVPCSPSGADGNAMVVPAAPHEYVGVGATKIKCQVCSQVWKVNCGTSAFVCALCGAKVLVALSSVAHQANTQADNHLAAAKAEVKTIMEQQAAVSQDLWEQLVEEVNLAQALWDSQEVTASTGDGGFVAQAHAVLQEATAARAVAQVAEALTLASEAGLPPPSVSMSEILVRLRDEEELEMLWRCILNALQEEDRVDLKFWCEEAKSQDPPLVVPQVVYNASKALSGAEKARLAELEYAAGLDTKAQKFRESGDVESMQKLAEEARLLGADPSIVEAHLEALRLDSEAGGASAVPPPGTVTDSPRTFIFGGPSGPSGQQPSAGAPTAHGPMPSWGGSAGSQEGAPSEAAHRDLNDMSVEELRQQSVGALKAELARFGMDSDGICEKEELVHVLLAARASSQEHASAGQSAGAGPGPFSSAAPPPPRPTPQPQPKPQEQPKAEATPELPKELQGRWYRTNGSMMEIMGSNIVWQDGSIARIWPQGDNKFNVILEGRAYHAKLQGDRIYWSDGDVWTKTPPPSRPAPGAGPRAGPKPKAQVRAPPVKGPMNYSQALACLELGGDPSEEDIKKAYKKAALRWHPDRRQNHDCADVAKEKFQEVRAAFELLQGATFRR